MAKSEHGGQELSLAWPGLVSPVSACPWLQARLDLSSGTCGQTGWPGPGEPQPLSVHLPPLSRPLATCEPQPLSVQLAWSRPRPHPLPSPPPLATSRGSEFPSSTCNKEQTSGEPEPSAGRQRGTVHCPLVRSIKATLGHRGETSTPRAQAAQMPAEPGLTMLQPLGCCKNCPMFVELQRV